MKRQNRILIIDDSRIDRHVIRNVLMRETLEVLEATSGAEALKIIDRENIDLIMLDMHMPQMDGLEVCAQLRGNPRHAEIPVIFLTADADAKQNVARAATGANDYIIKPFVAEELLLRVRIQLRFQEQLRESRRLQQELDQTLEQLHKGINRSDPQGKDPFRELREAQERLQQSESLFRGVIHHTPDCILIIDESGVIELFSPGAERLFGYSAEEAVGQNVRLVIPALSTSAEDAHIAEFLVTSIANVLGSNAGREMNGTHKSGVTFPMHLTLGEMWVGTQRKLVAVARDISERKRAEEEMVRTNQELEAALKKLQQTQAELLQAEKLASVGQLAAGIAHEINTPIQFVGDNVRACSEMFVDLQRLLEGYRTLEGQLEDEDRCAIQRTRIRRLEEEIDVDYIFKDVPEALSQSQEGLKRVSTIIRAMKDFSHSGGSDEKVAFDVNAALKSTLTVARNELKYIAEIETDFADLPPVAGYPGELNQVFLNLFINAAHAIQDKGADGMGSISVRTRIEENCVIVSVSDTGCGIPQSVRNKIFDPFFTTKDIGRGTGQGLAISHSILVERHGGRIEYETEVDVGTTFHVYLPLSSSAEKTNDHSCVAC